MKSQDRNYMPEVVSHAFLGHGKVFIFNFQWLQTATEKLPSDFQEHSRKVAFINTVDVGPIKDERNRLEWSREMAVGVRRHSLKHS